LSKQLKKSLYEETAPKCDLLLVFFILGGGGGKKLKNCFQCFIIMIKTEIIGFDQKINRAVKLVELSDTLTQKRHLRHGRCGREGGKSVFFCP
jgi:hypothetical protein